MNTKKALEVLEMLKNYVNENWDEEYREDIDDVNEMHDYLVPILSDTKIAGNAVINGESYLIIRGGYQMSEDLISRKEAINKIVQECQIYELDGKLFYDAREVDRILNNIPTANDWDTPID